MSEKRDVFAAADHLMNADQSRLHVIVLRDPDMIRDVAAALVWWASSKGADRRQEFIRMQLPKGLRRSDIVKAFGISPAQASVDIRTYRDGHPRAMRYDASQKVYLPND